MPLVAITSSAVRYHGLCRVFHSKVRSQILGAISPPEFDMAIKLMGLSEVSVSQLHRGKEQDRQIPAGAAGWKPIAVPAHGKDLLGNVQEGTAWPGGESCCYSKNVSLRSG